MRGWAPGVAGEGVLRAGAAPAGGLRGDGGSLWDSPQHRPLLVGGRHPPSLGDGASEQGWGSPRASALAGAFPVAVAFLPRRLLLAESG